MASLTSLLLILLFFSAGYLSRKAVNQPQDLAQRLNLIVINLAFPAVILRVVPDLSLPGEAIFMAAAPWVIVACSGLSMYLLGRWLGWRREVVCATMVLAAVGNTGFLGYPLIQAFFTSEQLGMGIIFDQFGSFVALCSYVSILAAIYSGQGKIRLGAVVKRVVRFPPFITLIVALLLPSGTIPDPMQEVLRVVGWSIIPLTMFSIGLQFNFRLAPDMVQPLVLALMFKMLVVPVLVFALGAVLGVSDTMLDVAVFQAAMPPMVTGAVVLISAGLAPRLAAATLGFGTLVALAYLPLLAILLQATSV